MQLFVDLWLLVSLKVTPHTFGTEDGGNLGRKRCSKDLGVLHRRLGPGNPYGIPGLRPSAVPPHAFLVLFNVAVR